MGKDSFNLISKTLVEGVVAETIVVRELLRNPVGEPWGVKGAIPHPLDQGVELLPS